MVPDGGLTMRPGYSDKINHAFAFAAKHHDRQVRKGTKLPYLTHPANVALILTRYGQADDTVVAGILHDVIEDTPLTLDDLAIHFHPAVRDPAIRFTARA